MENLQSGVYASLPSHIIKPTEELGCPEDFFKQDVAPTDKRDVSLHLSRTVHIQQSAMFRKKRSETKKKKYLSRKERKKAGLVRLSKSGHNYKHLEPIRQMWLQYVEEALGDPKDAPDVSDKNYQNFHIALTKIELIGATLTVIRSKCPRLVHMSGTVVLETKNTFQVVTKKDELKILLKAPCVFQFCWRNLQFSLLGKYFLNRSADRSIKKNKIFNIPEL